jgi:hypothetical protein
LNVVNLGETRDLLQHWDEFRRAIAQGHFKGAAVCLKTQDGTELVFFAGAYKDDPESALSAAMRLSMELTQQSDFRASQ